MRRRFLALLVLFTAIGAAFLVLSNKGRRSTPALSSVDPSILRWPQGSLPLTLDWNMAKDRRSLQHAAFVMEGLFKLSADGGEVRALPDLAESWELLDRNVIRIRLRDSIHWSNGQALSSVHVVNGWKYLLRNASRQPMADALFSILNAREFSTGRVAFADVGIKITDGQHVLVTLKQADPYFVQKLAHPSAWPRYSPAERKFRADEPVLGPFVREKLSSNEAITYAQNPHYHAGAPALKSIETRRVTSPLVRLELLLSGESDFVDDIPDEIAAGLLPQGQVTFEPAPELMLLAFNEPRGIFSTPAARAAFFETIRLKELHEIASSRLWPVGSFLHAGWETQSLSWPTRSAPASGRKFLENVVNQARGTIRLSLGIAASEPAVEEVAKNLQAQWQRALGIKVEFSRDIDNSDLILSMITQNWMTPVNTLRSIGGASKSFESLMIHSERAPTLEKAMQILRKAELLISQEENLVLPLARTARVVLRSPSLKEMHQDPLQLWSVASARLE